MTSAGQRSKFPLSKAILVIFIISCLVYSSVAPKSFALFPTRPEIKITSHKTGDLVNAGNLTISGTSNDNSSTDCQVFVDWNGLKPVQKAIAAGPNGTNDYSAWNFTYTSSYHLVTNGSNKINSKMSCIDDDEYLAKWYIINLTGVDQRSENKSQFLESLQNENLTDNYQRAIFSSLKIIVPTYSEAKTLIKDKKTQSKTSSEDLKEFLVEYVKLYSKLQNIKLTPQQKELTRLLPVALQENPTPSQKIQLEAMLPNLIGSLLRDQEAGQKESNPLLVLAKSLFSPSEWNMYVGAFNLGGTLGAQSKAGQLNFGDLLLAMGSVYLSIQVGGIVGPDVIYGIAKAVIPAAINLLSGLGRNEIPIQQVGYAIPADPCESDTNIPQCDPNLIPIPFENCDVGNVSVCSDVDPIRAIGYCDDGDFDCIVSDSYVPPLPGSDGYYYYPTCDFNFTDCEPDEVGTSVYIPPSEETPRGGIVQPEGTGTPEETPRGGIVQPEGTGTPEETPPGGIVPPEGTGTPEETPPGGIVPPEGTGTPEETPPGGIVPPEGTGTPEETPPGGIVPPEDIPEENIVQSEDEVKETPSQQEDDGNYCPSDDRGCDGIPDISEPSWCSDLQGGCENFTVCDEEDCNYDRDLVSEDDIERDSFTGEEQSTENGNTGEEQSTENGNIGEEQSTENGNTGEEQSTENGNTGEEQSGEEGEY